MCVLACLLSIITSHTNHTHTHTQTQPLRGTQSCVCVGKMFMYLCVCIFVYVYCICTFTSMCRIWMSAMRFTWVCYATPPPPFQLFSVSALDQYHSASSSSFAVILSTRVNLDQRLCKATAVTMTQTPDWFSAPVVRLDDSAAQGRDGKVWNMKFNWFKKCSYLRMGSAVRERGAFWDGEKNAV